MKMLSVLTCFSVWQATPLQKVEARNIVERKGQLQIKFVTQIRGNAVAKILGHQSLVEPLSFFFPQMDVDLTSSRGECSQIFCFFLGGFWAGSVSRFFAFVLDGNRFLRCIDCIDGEI